jgi:hypothetical protein
VEHNVAFAGGNAGNWLAGRGPIAMPECVNQHAQRQQ